MGINLSAHQDQVRFFKTHRFVTNDIGVKAAAFEFVAVPSGMGAHVAFLWL